MAKGKSNRVEQKSNSVRLTAMQQKVLEFCNEIPRTTQEILEMVGGVKCQTRSFNSLLHNKESNTNHKNRMGNGYFTCCPLRLLGITCYFPSLIFL